MQVSVDVLRKLQRCKARIRNICVMAHVDHGKTTLSDCLIASNGLIHPKLVGELRYLDSREDEQIRGITMKSSSISLVYRPNNFIYPSQEEDLVQSGYLINLIDSPGHVDFCSEVSTAARLTDGCLILVDAVEGVCIQTHAVLRQAWDEKVHPCLVINKIDRLIVSLKMTPSEVYMRLRQIISDVNLIMSAFESEKYISEANAVLAHEVAKEAFDNGDPNQNTQGNWGQSEDDMFSPIKGNVVFGSAIDGWGFRIQDFAEMYAEKLGARVDALNKALWGDFHYQPKTKSVSKIKAGIRQKATKPMFVQLILEPIYNAYTALEPDSDFEGILGKIVKSRNLQKGSKKLTLGKDKKQAFKAVMSAWLSISDAVLQMVIQHLPNPIVASQSRIPNLIQEFKAEKLLSPKIQSQFQTVMNELKSSSSEEEAHCVIYVSKMIAVDASWLPRTAEKRMGGDVFLAFGRVFSGVARKGLRVHILSSGYDPSDPFTRHRQIATLGNLYLMMGRGLEWLDDVPAGNVLAIEGLDEVIHKSATISSTPFCPPIVSMTFQCAAIVRVAVEPSLPSELPKLEQGLKKLCKADPFVEVELLPTGEHVVAAAGEVHLLTCLKDLKERYAKIDLEVSPPLVAFRETVTEGDESKIIEAATPTGACEVRVRAHPLPKALANLLTESQDDIRHLIIDKIDAGSEDLRSRVQTVLEDFTPSIKDLLKRTWLLGPKRMGPNLLLASNQNRTSLFDSEKQRIVQLDKKRGTRLQKAPVPSTTPKVTESHQNGESEDEDESKSQVSGEAISTEFRIQFPNNDVAQLLGFSDPSKTEVFDIPIPESLKKVYGSVESGLIAGFQLATAAGPLCDEPMWGVAFEIDVRLVLPYDDQRQTKDPDLGEDNYGPFHGQVKCLSFQIAIASEQIMTVVKSCCRQALMEGYPRLAEAFYLCEISTTSEFLSGVYSVIARRRGRILREEMREGSHIFIVHAYLPVEASFGLADELRSRSSGAASCSLLFSHWERLDVDPFFVPTTEEEREEFGDEMNLDSTNLARRLIFAVRKRKGRVVQEKVVESATKQRTLSKKV